MLKTRVITAAIALPLFLFSLYYLPEWCVMLLFLASVIISTYEVAIMLIPTVVNACNQYGEQTATSQNSCKEMIVVCVGIASAIFLASVWGGSQAGRGMIVFGILGTMLMGVFSANNVFTSVGSMMGAVVSICYGVLPWLAVWDLYLWGNAQYLLFLFAIVWGGDTGAYFVGMKWGKTPLSRKSPKKTWEGAVGGLVSSILCAILVNVFYEGTIAPITVVVFSGLFGGIFAQLGDLLESSFKRFAHVKDSGQMFPGHGGFLDRVDGVLFAAPVIWFIIYVSRFGF